MGPFNKWNGWEIIYTWRIPISFHFPQKVPTFFSWSLPWTPTYNRELSSTTGKTQFTYFHWLLRMGITIGPFHTGVNVPGHSKPGRVIY